MNTPRRIVCLTEETTETLYLLGEQDRIVGISGFTVRPPQARQEKPRVSAFTRAKIDKILALKPDLVLGFSDLQADIMAELVRAGLPVHVFNQRTVAGIFEMMRMLGAMLGEQEKTAALIQKIEAQVADVRQQASTLARRPIVYFEEWNDPLITAIGWVSELIGIAGGEDCYPELSLCGLAKDRIIADPLDVARRQPDIIVGSWCGRKFRPQRVAERPGWQQVPAVVTGDIYGIASPDILQPGPAALTDGLQQLTKIIHNWASRVRVPTDNLLIES